MADLTDEELIEALRKGPAEGEAWNINLLEIARDLAARVEAVIAERDRLIDESIDRGAGLASLETVTEERDEFRGLFDAELAARLESETESEAMLAEAIERAEAAEVRVAELEGNAECGHPKRFTEHAFDRSVPDAEPSEWCVYCEWEGDHARRYELEAEALRFYKADGTFDELESAEAVVEKRKDAAFELADLQRWKREAMIVLDRWEEVAKLVPCRVGESKAKAAFAEVRRLQALEPGGWQPIETAPKDGRTVLLLLYGQARTGCWNPGGCFGDHWDFGNLPEDEEPTHWMPLPPAPAGAESAGGEA